MAMSFMVSGGCFDSKCLHFGEGFPAKWIQNPIGVSTRIGSSFAGEFFSSKVIG